MKRILIVSTNGFSKVNCNKTYESMFKGFDKEQLYSLFFRPHDSNIDFDYCSSYYAVSEANIISKILHPEIRCGGEIDQENTDEKIAETRSSSLRYYSFFKRRNSLKQMRFLKDMLWKTNLWFTEELRAWLRKVKPDVIFFHDPGTIGYIHSINVISNFLKGTPIVYYITDDYYCYNNETLSDRIYLKLIKPQCQRLINRSQKCYCIGEMMANAYGPLFNKEFEVIMNSVPLSAMTKKPEVPQSITYFGSLHLDRWKMISRFSNIFDGDIKVYTSSEITPEIKQSFKDRDIHYMGSVVGNALTKAIEESEALLHIESDDEKYMKRTRLAVSTKIPEYMASGRVIIAYGNPELA